MILKCEVLRTKLNKWRALGQQQERAGHNDFQRHRGDLEKFGRDYHESHEEPES